MFIALDTVFFAVKFIVSESINMPPQRGEGQLHYSADFRNRTPALRLFSWIVLFDLRSDQAYEQPPLLRITRNTFFINPRIVLSVLSVAVRGNPFRTLNANQSSA